MKKLIIACAAFAAFSASAATVKVTSFNLIRIADDLNHPVAELCGKVEGSTKVEFLRVLVDAGSRRPAVYNTLSDEKGNFCLTLVTYRGTAEVSLMGSTQIKTQAQL
jgi:hypothetical protein